MERTYHRPLVAAAAALFALSGMASAFNFVPADHEQKCYEESNSTTLTEDIEANNHYWLCIHGGVQWEPEGFDTNFLVWFFWPHGCGPCPPGSFSDTYISQPYGETPVVFVMTAVVLHDCHAIRRTTVAPDQDDNGNCVDMQGGNNNYNWVWFANNMQPAPGDPTWVGTGMGATCVAESSQLGVAGTHPVGIKVRGNYRSQLFAGFPHDRHLLMGGDGPEFGEPFFFSEFLEFGIPSQISTFIEDVHIHSGNVGQGDCVGKTVVVGINNFNPRPGGVLDPTAACDHSDSPHPEDEVQCGSFALTKIVGLEDEIVYYGYQS